MGYRMPIIRKSELRKIRTSWKLCRFPSLTEHAIHLRDLHRYNPEFHKQHTEHNRRIAKTKKYNPEKYKKMTIIGYIMGTNPLNEENRKKTIKINGTKRGRKPIKREVHKRINTYAGVVTEGELRSL